MTNFHQCVTVEMEKDRSLVAGDVPFFVDEGRLNQPSAVAATRSAQDSHVCAKEHCELDLIGPEQDFGKGRTRTCGGVHRQTRCDWLFLFPPFDSFCFLH